jgi:hypothetical protein
MNKHYLQKLQLSAGKLVEEIALLKDLSEGCVLMVSDK